ncbi:unnamed protein product [Heligmosomoides polygyrus]|uniref:CTNNB1_binding domain-containing protein n=1 Tax=Heligmosomoides polygyrus TaxID=6339 RepID=A0A183FVT9_HELPZ|nr:unnamed protein product [Heligmosomoides polygyrus]
MWSFQPPGGSGYPPQVVGPSGLHPAAVYSDSASNNDDDDRDETTMDGTLLGIGESARAGAVSERRTEPKAPKGRS